jgi:hypothetical protein
MNYIVKEGVEAYSTINNIRNNQDKQKSINRAEHRGDSRFYQNKDLTTRVSDGRSMACFMTF